MAKKQRLERHRNQKKKRLTKSSQSLYDNPSRRLDRAKLLWFSGKTQQALQAYVDAVRLEPENIRAYVLAARAHGELCQLDQVEAILAKLIRRAPEHPGVHHYVGETYAQMNLPKAALAAYERAAASANVLPGTWMELASAYERSHRLEEAWELIERTEAAGFDLPLVWLTKSRLQRRLKQPDAAESTLREFIRRQPADNRWVCQAWGEIALILDRAGNYDGAIEAVEQCKRVQRARSDRFARNAATTAVRLNNMVADLRREHLERWARESAALPEADVALLTGFPRSGTTLLEQILDAHPRLVSNEERDYLGRSAFPAVIGHADDKNDIVAALNSVALSKLKYHRSSYLAVMEKLLGEPIGGRMHLDKNPAYNLTIPLLLRLFPEARLVIALRDPRDVILSCYLRYLPLNSVSVWFLSPEKTAERYAMDMRGWLKLRDLIPGPWCEVRYEETVVDLEQQARKTLDVLGLPWDQSVLDYRERLTGEKRVSSPTYEAVAEPIYTHAIGRWKNYEKHLEHVFEKLQPFIAAFGYSA